MPRPQNENRIKAKELFLESGGLLKNPEIAETLGVKSEQIRKWKCVDKWVDALQNQPKNKGGQKANQNAKGYGAPPHNTNAETHGAYSKVYFNNLSPDEKRLIESVSLNTTENMLRELQTLIAKQKDLEKRIAEYNTMVTGELYTDKVVEMRTPNKEEDSDPYGHMGDGGNNNNNNLNLSMETTVKSSAFERAMKLETELNKIHGRIIKLLDSVKSYELENRRIAIEEKRYTLMKQRVSGVFDVDPDTGEIEDGYTHDTDTDDTDALGTDILDED